LVAICTAGRSLVQLLTHRSSRHTPAAATADRWPPPVIPNLRRPRPGLHRRSSPPRVRIPRRGPHAKATPSL
jgi:hypothetical protein